MKTKPSIYAGFSAQEVLATDFLKNSQNAVHLASDNYRNIKIHQRARNFGHVPNWNDWQPGDLILVSSEQQGWITRGISTAQTNLGLGENSVWHHVALHIERGSIIEATRSGIHLDHISKYVGDHAFMVRRVARASKQNFSRDDQWRIALKAMEKVGLSYSFRTIIYLFNQSLGKKNHSAIPLGWRSGSSRICSTFCMEAVSLGASVAFSDFNLYESMPGEIAIRSELETVPLCWMKI